MSKISEQMRDLLSNPLQEGNDKEWGELSSLLDSLVPLAKRMMSSAGDSVSKKVLSDLFRAARDAQKHWDGE